MQEVSQIDGITSLESAVFIGSTSNTRCLRTFTMRIWSVGVGSTSSTKELGLPYLDAQKKML